MLATGVIGLREGLEAALIVGIVAAFLKRNGQPMRPLWVGVVAAVLLSIAVGVGLAAMSASLPQAPQEGMETIIGAVAVVFVTGMILWMNGHARGMRRELERNASEALAKGTAWALAGMAFLAVVKEGFETSVFLLATFQSATDAPAAAAGAVIGVLIAVFLGIGIYRGGVKLNLGRLFKATGVFLVFVAAGLVLSCLRTAHEAGWITIGQQRTLDLSWLAPNGSVQAALVTGVLGIPADPRTIEVLGWLLYLVPMLAYMLWPARWRPREAVRPVVLFAAAGALAVIAAALTVAVPASSGVAGDAAPLVRHGKAVLSLNAGSAVLQVTRDGSVQTVRFPSSARSTDEHAGVPSTHWHRTQSIRVPDLPRTLSLDDLLALNGGRLPVGIDAQRDPGPFTASWTNRTDRSLWSVQGRLLDARSEAASVLTLSGGGLDTARTVTIDRTKSDWAVQRAYVRAAADASNASEELLLWKLWLPVVLGFAALALTVGGFRLRRRDTGTAPILETRHEPGDAGSEPTKRKTGYAVE